MNLPEYPGVSRESTFGRNIYEGYQRGCGIMFGDLHDQIAKDPDFAEAYRLADGRTVVWRPRLMNLYLLIRFFLPKLDPGNIIEFGSFRGGSAFFMANLARKYLPGTQVYAFDTFEGMPPTEEIDAHSEGDFSATSYDEVARAKSEAGLDNLHLVKGRFEDTAREFLSRKGKTALAHIDCDIYGAALYCFEAAKDSMVDGGYIVFDDATEATCIGATQAVEEIIVRYNLRSEQISPHFVFRWPPHSKSVSASKSPTEFVARM